MIDAKKVKRLNAKVPELMGATEVASELGVKRQNLNKVVGLPDPVPQELARGMVWRADLVREFAAERRDRLGL